MNRKEVCELCTLHNKISTDALSPSDGLVSNPKHSNVLMVSDYKSKGEYLLTINFCPMCGKRIK